MKKVLGLTTLALVGILTLTGCDKNVAVTDTTENTTENTTAAYTTLNKSEAMDIVKLTLDNLLFNVDGVRNNVLISVDEDGNKNNQSYYVDENGREYLLYEVENGTTYYEYVVHYQKAPTTIDTSSDEVYMYAKRMNNAPVEYTKRLEAYGDLSKIYKDVLSSMRPMVEEDNLIEYKLLNNGDYKFTFTYTYVANESSSSILYTLIIGSNNQLKEGRTTNIWVGEEHGDTYSHRTTETFTFKYGEANVAKINEMVAEANAYNG